MAEGDGNSNTIFEDDKSAEGNTNPPVTPDSVVPAAPSIPEGVADFVGEGKKYATLEDALKSVPHAQGYIEQLKNEVETLKSKVQDSSSMAEQIQALKDDMAQATQTQQTTVTQPTINTDDIAGIVKETVQGMNADDVAASNLNKADLAVKEKYGDNAVVEFKKIAEDNGFNAEEMQLLASKSPKAFLKLFDISDQVKDIKATPASGGSINTDAFQSSPPAPAKSVMGGANSADLKAAWAAAAPSTN